MMKQFLTFLMIIISSIGYSQQVLEYEEIRNEIENSSKSLNTSLEIPNQEFYVGIIKDLIVENITLEPCIEIETTDLKNKRLIELFKEYKLLNNLYIEIGNDLENLNSNQTLKKEDSVLNIELIYRSKNSMGVIFIPILEEELAKDIISDLEKIFENRRCFKTLKRKLNT